MSSFNSKFFTSTFKKKIFDLLKLSIGGTITFCGIGLYANNAEFYKTFVMPAFHILNPESAHKLSIFMTKHKLVPHEKLNDNQFLKSSVCGVNFENPIGVAAGYDKNGEAVEGLFQMGFGFVEVGSVTPKPQPGNPRPRIFRLTDAGGIINRCGFNSDGHDAVFERLSKLDPPGKRKGAVGVNLGKNKDSKDPVNDYTLGIRKFGPIADYLVINVSSPNTPGLRKLQQRKELEKLLAAAIKERDNLLGNHKPPIFLKISPDLSYEEKEDIVHVISLHEHRVDGLIVSNTTVSRPQNISSEHLKEGGGLSGRPLSDLATSTIRDMARLTKGQFPIIGVGGICNGEDAKEKIYNGAHLLQIYSVLVFDGPPVVKRIASELANLLREDGHTHLSSAIGSKLK